MNGANQTIAELEEELSTLRARVAHLERAEAEHKRAATKLRGELAVNAALSELYEPLISPSSTIKEIADTVLDRARSLTGSAQGYVSATDPVTGDNVGHTLSEMLKGQCEVSGDKRRIAFPRGSDGCYGGLGGHALNTRKAFYTNSPERHPAASGVPEGHIPIRRFLSVPVMLGEELVGQIALANPERDYTGGDLAAVQRLGEFYALAIQRKRAEDALREARDELENRVQERTAELSGANKELRWEIGERERAEEELRKGEARLSNAQRVARMGFWEWDILTNDLYWSDEIYRIFGLSPQEFGATYDAFLSSVHPDDREFVRSRVDAAVYDRAEYDIDHRIVLPSGEVRHVHEQGEVTRDANGAPFRMVGTVIDITARKQAEEARRLDDARLEALLKLNEMAETSLQQVADFALEEAVELTKSKFGFLGFMNEDESAMTIDAWSGGAMQECGVADRPTVFRIAGAGLWGETVRQRRPIVVNDYAALKTWKGGLPAGHVPLARFLGVPVFEGERIVAVVAVANKEDEYQEGDVRQLTLLMSGLWQLVQRQQAQQALRESEERLQAILDNTTAVIYLKDVNGRFFLTNQRFRELFHVPRAEIVGKSDYDLFPKQQADTFRANDEKVLATRAAVEFEEVVRQDDGLHTYISIKFPLYDADGEPYAVCGISTDITERKRVEEKLRHSERLASLGAFAAGLAHEVNNPLASILMTARLAQKSRRNSRTAKTALEEIVEDAERCARIVKGVLQFAKKQPSEKWPLKLNDIVRRAGDLARRYAHRRGVRLEVKLCESLPSLVANRTDVEQAFVNVINNAIEASEAGQCVVVRAERTSDKARVRVQDHGRGMTKEEKERAFDPFFTTRSKDGGIGLGLSMAHGTVAEHNGTISIDTEPGRGTTVTIEFPLLAPSAETGAL